MGYNPMLANMAARFSPANRQPQQGYSQNVNPFMTSVDNGMSPNVYAVNPESVRASQGAGASPGADWTSRVGQQVGQDMGQMQHQQGAAQAAMMRNTNTPGGVDQWANMMQGLQQARGGAMLAGTPMGQAYGNARNTAAASALRNTNTPGGVSQYAPRPQPGQQGPPNWQQMMGQGPRRS